MSGEEAPGGAPLPPIDRGTGERFLIVLGCAFIVLYGIHAAGAFLAPVLLAALLSTACIRPVKALESRRVPTSLAVVVVLLAAGLLLLVTSIYVGSSIHDFQQSDDFKNFGFPDDLKALFKRWHIPVGQEGSKLADLFPTERIREIVADIATTLLSGLSSSVIVLLLMFFMLVELAELPAKMRRAFRLPDEGLGGYERVAIKVHDYVSIKTAVSILTGALVVVLCVVTGVRYPPLWGLIAFLFNYVPNIGSFIAAIPVVMLALIQKAPGADGSVVVWDYTRAAWVAGGFLAINLIVGNVVEPRVMGSRLGLSPLVVFLSLLLWGAILGPIGMLVSVPLTVAIKVMLESSDDLSWLAVLLGPGEDEPASGEGTRSDPPSAGA